MNEGVKMFLFLMGFVGLGIIFRGPLATHWGEAFPDQASKEERRVVGTVSRWNPRVQEAQRELKMLGFYGGAVDGKMGKETRQALVAFQQKSGLSVSGKLDTRTVHALKQQTVVAPVKSENRAEANNRNMVKQRGPYDAKVAQAILKKGGFYNGKIDGKVGPRTKGALKQFQRVKKLVETGEIDSATWEALKRYEQGG